MKTCNLETVRYTKIKAKCPNCHTEQFGVDNYIKYGLPYSYYGANCKNCGFATKKLTINTDESVTIEFDDQQDFSKRTVEGLLLVKLAVTNDKPIYFILNQPIYDFFHTGDKSIDDSMQYLVESHSCPYNYLRFEIIAGTDTDPHGILKYVQLVPKPQNKSDPNYDWRTEFDSYDQLCQLFDRLPVREIDGIVAIPPKLIG